jgi:hypothetical protein
MSLWRAAWSAAAICLVDVEIVGSIPTGPHAFRQINREREDRIPNRSLLGKTGALGPMAGSPETLKRQEDDRRREGEISTVISICHC